MYGANTARGTGHSVAAICQGRFEDARASYKEGKTVGRVHKGTASLKAKKIIVNGLIHRVEVYWDYQLRIDFAQFCLELNV